MSIKRSMIGVGVLALAVAGTIAWGQTNPEFSGSVCINHSNCGNCLAGSSVVQNQCPQAPHILCGVFTSSTASGDFRACQDSSSPTTNPCNPTGGSTYDCGDSSSWYCGCANGDGVCGFVACDCNDQTPPSWTGNPPPRPTCT